MLDATKDVTMEQLWTWARKGGIGRSGHIYFGHDRCIDFEKDVWFNLGKIMWKRYQSVFQYIARGLQPLSQRLLILIETALLGCCIRIRRVMVSYLTANIMGKKIPKHHGAHH